MIEYSSAGRNVLNLFHNVDAIFYVEGDDDIIFWAKYIENSKIKIIPVHGKDELLKVCNQIINDEISDYVGIDSDYDYYLKLKNINHYRNIPTHKNIIQTKSYSIENIIFCENTISKIAQLLARTQENNFLEDVKDWYQKTEELLKKLLVMDIINEVEGFGLSILGDSCQRFLKKQNGIIFDKQKIDTIINQNNEIISDSLIDEYEKLIQDDERDFCMIIRGHFLQSAVINLLKKIIKKRTRKNIRSISLDQIYCMAVESCSHCDDNCLYHIELCNKVSLAIGA